MLKMRVRVVLKGRQTFVFKSVKNMDFLVQVEQMMQILYQGYAISIANARELVRVKSFRIRCFINVKTVHWVAREINEGGCAPL